MSIASDEQNTYLFHLTVFSQKPSSNYNLYICSILTLFNKVVKNYIRLILNTHIITKSTNIKIFFFKDKTKNILVLRVELLI